MTGLDEILRSASAELRALGAAHALVGGLAVGARTRPRFTADVDLAVAVSDDAEAERIVIALISQGYRVMAQIEQEATGRLATVRLAPPGSSVVALDLLFASSGIEGETVAAAEPLELAAGVVVPIAAVPHLIALKILSDDPRTRPQDRSDLLALLAEAEPEQIDAARELLQQVRARGCHRDRDLLAALDALLDGDGAGDPRPRP